MVETSTSVLKIGRSPENDLVVAHPEVSSFHASVRQVSAHTWLLEDHSTNGTYVNGQRVQRTLLAPESEVLLAGRYRLDLSPLFPPPPPEPVPSPEAYRAAFQKLAHVYRHYEETKLALLNKDTLKQGLIRAGCGVVPIIGPAIGQILAAQFVKPHEKMMALDNELKVNYVCPRCKTFPGNVPFQALVNQRQCARCKLDWV